MNSKLTHTGIGVMAAGAVGIIIAIVMELITAEPIYLQVMKATALLFGVGGTLIGLGSRRRKIK